MRPSGHPNVPPKVLKLGGGLGGWSGAVGLRSGTGKRDWVGVLDGGSKKWDWEGGLGGSTGWWV